MPILVVGFNHPIPEADGPLGESGDVFGKAAVRLLELVESVEMIKKCVEQNPLTLQNRIAFKFRDPITLGMLSVEQQAARLFERS